MINRGCIILQKGKGFCWRPGVAWNVTENDLCRLCWEKNQTQGTKTIDSGTQSHSPKLTSARRIRAAA